MGRYRKKASKFFARLVVYGLGRKHRSAFASLSKSFRAPAPQTSLIFELPDELILLILSFITPDPRPATGHSARFRIQYNMEISNDHQQRVKFLRPLSVTCRTMRMRLLPWVWERLEVTPRRSWNSGDVFAGKLNAIGNASHANMFLAASVKFMTVQLQWNVSTASSFVKCLVSLPNLHTLEIMSADGFVTVPLKTALKRVKLPQIKTLMLPPTAHPLLQHCHNLEDVICVVKYKTVSHEFLGSLASNHDSKVKRLAIPLVLWSNPSRFVAACPKLTELTIIYPHPDDADVTESGPLLDPLGGARSATSELIQACKALPDFDTLQILHFPTVAPLPICGCGRMRSGSLGPPMDQRRQALREEVKCLKDWAMECLRNPETGREEGAGRKKIALRTIELSSDRPRAPKFHLASVKVEECEV